MLLLRSLNIIQTYNIDTSLQKELGIAKFCKRFKIKFLTVTKLLKQLTVHVLLKHKHKGFLSFSLSHSL